MPFPRAALVMFAAAISINADLCMADITVNGNCNVIVTGIQNAQISIYIDKNTCQSPGATQGSNNSIQDIQGCDCTVRTTFVQRLEAEILKMCSGICELPGYDRAYDMLTRLTSQVPVCCHKAILTEVMQSKDVNCKVKLLGSARLETPAAMQEDIIQAAKTKFRYTPDICYNQ